MQEFSLFYLSGYGSTTRLFFTDVPSGRFPQVIAHRGVHQIYADDTRAMTTCRASQVLPITHEFIENTIPSMEAAFGLGADIVELDIHMTTDGALAVFHDWTLECQTDGVGVTNEQSSAYLKNLDIGYNFSSDGQNFPLRGKGQGMMPLLDEVFDAGLGGQYLINIKSNRPEEGEALLSLLSEGKYEARVWGVYGGEIPTRIAIEGSEQRLGSSLTGYDKSSLINCVFAYMALGWSGIVPKTCHDQVIGIPANYTPFVWGWPHKFTERMKSVGTEVILWGRYDGSGFTSGIDSVEDLKYVPANFDGYVWTNRIEIIGPTLKEHFGTW